MELVNVNVFIDWDTARRIVRPSWAGQNNVDIRDRKTYVLNCFSQLQVKIGTAVQAAKLHAPARVSLTRIYHGWHKGRTPTDDRRAWDIAKSELAPYIIKGFSYLPDIKFGDEMICGGRRMPLLDTLRSRSDGVEQQKMVDTALVSDLLSFCRAESGSFKRGQPKRSMAIVIGNDDDLLPGSFVAEQWGLPVMVLRLNRDSESKFVNTSGIVFPL